MKIASGVFLLFLLRNSLCIPLSQFYPFGSETTESTNTIPREDDDTSPSISLQPSFNFFGQLYTSLYVSINSSICKSCYSV